MTDQPHIPGGRPGLGAPAGRPCAAPAGGAGRVPAQAHPADPIGGGR
jgi:hypothetical protein